MTLRPALNIPSTPLTPIDPITASRLAHAASREVSGNLFRLLADLSSTDQASQSPPSHDDGADLGPPWDDDTVTTQAAKAASKSNRPADA